MVKIISPIRDKISLSNELLELIKNSHKILISGSSRLYFDL